MLKIIGRYPIVCICAVVFFGSLGVMLILGSYSLYGVIPMLVAAFVVGAIMNFKVFGVKADSSIHRPGADAD